MAQVTPLSEGGPVGRLEAVIDGRAVGWAYDSAAPDSRIALELKVDGERIGRVVADLERPSLVQAGMGDGRHAFVVHLPGCLRDGATHTIELILPTGEPLRVSHPLRVEASDSASEWSQARLVAAGDPAVSPLAVGPAPVISESRFVRSIDPASASAAYPRQLRLRPCDETHFFRREPYEGFSDAEVPEAIFLGDHVTMGRPDPLRFVVQPGVADPRAERERRVAEDGSYLARRPAICRLPGAIVDTAGFLTLCDEHQYLADSVRGQGFMPRLGYVPQQDGSFVGETRGIVEREERVVVLGAQTNYNFSHWLLESVARALLFKPFDDGTRRYLVPRLGRWPRETLELVGLGADRMLEVEPAGLVRFREVIAVSRGMTRMGRFVPAAIDALAGLGQASAEQRRLYVSRSRTKVRGVSNEPELAELFERHGFTVVCPETLPFSEQIELFASAEIVAGPHGSALTNVVFSRPGTLVIELQPERQDGGVIEYLWNLCAAREHRFVQVVCRHTPGMETLPISHRDVTVDLPHLDRLLSSLLPG